MLDFYEHKFVCLVCTTIVESAWTSQRQHVIIDNADKLGLAQLTSCGARRALARRLRDDVPQNKQLSKSPSSASGALASFRSWAGYKIALRDLELAGAGNLLGAEQSARSPRSASTCTRSCWSRPCASSRARSRKTQIPLPHGGPAVAASIPEKYVPSEAQRILMYKKLSAVRDRADVARLQEEFEDRFGDPPPPVWNALALLRLRLRCQEIGIESITTESHKITISFKKGVRIPVHNLKPLGAAFKAQGHTFTPEKVVMNVLSSKALPQTEEMVEVLARALTEKTPPRVSPGEGAGGAAAAARKGGAPAGARR
jgi:transcription-repair coupling factor (superfamily II helicase)